MNSGKQHRRSDRGNGAMDISEFRERMQDEFDRLFLA